MQKLLAMLTAVLLLSGQLFAQKNVTGKVTDEKGNPVANASVIVKGTAVGTTTRQDGTFTLSVPATGKALLISSVDMIAEEATIGSQTSINITLKDANKSLQEVVVVGYGTKAIREVTGAVSKVDGSKIFNEPVSGFNQALAGKTAGVQVNLSTGVLADRTAIRVRGINSISSGSQPLIVVDGVPQVATTNLNNFNSGNGTRFDPLSLINSADIESIEILKDAGASVLYGSRASNGVILVTTKKGKKGNVKVTFDSKTSWSSATKLPELLNGDQFIAISNEKANNRFAATTPQYMNPAKESDIDGDGVNDRTNWNDLLYRTGLTTDNAVSFSGGSDKMVAYGSFRYLNQEGIVLANKLRSGQARMNLEITPKTWFKAGVQLSYVRTLNNGILSDTYIAGTTVSGWMAPPTISAFNPKSSTGTGYNLTSAGLLSLGNNTPVGPSGTLLPSAAYYYNTYAALKLNRNDNTATDSKATIYGELQPIKNLRITSKFSMQYQSNVEDQYTSPYIAGLGTTYNGLLQDETRNWSNWVWSNYASYDVAINGGHKFGVVAGTEYQKTRYDYTYTGAANFSDPFFTHIIDNTYTNTQPGLTTVLNNTGGDLSVNALISYFGRFNYSYKGKYFVEGGFRRDGYSAFGISNQFGNFPSISAGWEITKENFMSSVKWLNYLKVRGSYGVVGNSNGLNDFASRTLYGGAAYTSLTGLGIVQQGNDNLQWESSKKLNVGFESNFLNGRLGLNVDYFRNNIDNLILAAPVLYTTGVPGSSIATNIGGMYNQGIEVTINATVISKKDFQWTSSLNFTTIRNKVTGLVTSNGNADITAGNQVASVGKALGTYKLPRWAGVDPATGNPTWYAGNGDIKMWDFASQSWKNAQGGSTTALSSTNGDYVYLDKTGLPTWYGGWDNTIKYKQFDLNVAVIFQGGNYIYNTTKASMLTNQFSNNFAVILDRWQKPGQITDVPKLWAQDNQANIASTRFLEKGDYARVRSITLGYTVDRNISGKIGIDNIRLFAQVFNPFTLTKYSGLDPDVNYNSFNNIAVGTDNRATPQVKAITVGAHVSF